MDGSSTSYMSEDVTIRCTVRKTYNVKSSEQQQNNNNLNVVPSPTGGGLSSYTTKTTTITNQPWIACTMRTGTGKVRPTRRINFGSTLRQRSTDAALSLLRPPTTNTMDDSTNNTNSIMMDTSENSNDNHSNHSHSYNQQQQNQHQQNTRCGPELLLTPIIDDFTSYNNATIRTEISPMRRSLAVPNGFIARSKSNTRSSLNSLGNGTIRQKSQGADDKNCTTSQSTVEYITKQCTIPVSEIIIAYIYDDCIVPYKKIHTVMYCGSVLEFENLSENAYIILLTFLQASIGTERIITKNSNNTSTKFVSIRSTNLSVSTSTHKGRNIAIASSTGEVSTARTNNNKLKKKSTMVKRNHSIDDHVSTSSTTVLLLDIDTLQEYHIGRIQNETWSEKLSRRISHIAGSLSDMCDFTTSGCCNTSNYCTTSSIDKTNIPYDDVNTKNISIEQRDMPPSMTIPIQPSSAVGGGSSGIVGDGTTSDNQSDFDSQQRRLSTKQLQHNLLSSIKTTPTNATNVTATSRPANTTTSTTARRRILAVGGYLEFDEMTEATGSVATISPKSKSSHFIREQQQQQQRINNSKRQQQHKIIDSIPMNLPLNSSQMTMMFPSTLSVEPVPSEEISNL